MTFSALADLMRQHWQELGRFLARRGTPKEDAEEILQETFIRYAECSRTENILNTRAWLFRTAGNLAVDYQRRSVNRMPHENDAIQLHALADNAPDPEECYQAQQRLEFLYQTLLDLPENCRRAFYLNRVEGMTYAEIAATLGVSESMVGKYLVQAMRHCRNRLKQS